MLVDGLPLEHVCFGGYVQPSRSMPPQLGTAVASHHSLGAWRSSWKRFAKESRHSISSIKSSPWRSETVMFSWKKNVFFLNPTPWAIYWGCKMDLIYLDRSSNRCLGVIPELEEKMMLHHEILSGWGRSDKARGFDVGTRDFLADLQNVCTFHA